MRESFIELFCKILLNVMHNISVEFFHETNEIE
jgi:hypothetical protein